MDLSFKDAGYLASYNSLSDPHLAGYFNNPRIKTHLYKIGLITRNGDAVTRQAHLAISSRLSQRASIHELLQQAKVHAQLEEDRCHRIAVLKKLDQLEKIELVRRIREETGQRRADFGVPLVHFRPSSPPKRLLRRSSSRPTSALRLRPQRPSTAPAARRRQHSLSSDTSRRTTSGDDDLTSTRSRSSSTSRSSSSSSSDYSAANVRTREAFVNRDEKPIIVPSATKRSLSQEDESRSGKAAPEDNSVLVPTPPKSRPAENRPSARCNRRLVHSAGRFPKESPAQRCVVTMHYFGSHLKLDSELNRTNKTDEITIEQQHNGGNTLQVFREHLIPKSDFSFVSRRHKGFPFSLTIYVNGRQDCRLSTCCEYKHQKGARLGAKQGHFGMVDTKGAQPCLRCQCRANSQNQNSSSSKTEKDNEKYEDDFDQAEDLESNDEGNNEKSDVEVDVDKVSEKNRNNSTSKQSENSGRKNGRDSTNSAEKRSRRTSTASTAVSSSRSEREQKRDEREKTDKGEKRSSRDEDEKEMTLVEVLDKATSSGRESRRSDSKMSHHTRSSSAKSASEKAEKERRESATDAHGINDSSKSDKEHPDRDLAERHRKDGSSPTRSDRENNRKMSDASVRQKEAEALKVKTELEEQTRVQKLDKINMNTSSDRNNRKMSDALARQKEAESLRVKTELEEQTRLQKLDEINKNTNSEEDSSDSSDEDTTDTSSSESSDEEESEASMSKSVPQTSAIAEHTSEPPRLTTAATGDLKTANEAPEKSPEEHVDNDNTNDSRNINSRPSTSSGDRSHPQSGTGSKGGKVSEAELKLIKSTTKRSSVGSLREDVQTKDVNGRNGTIGGVFDDPESLDDGRQSRIGGPRIVVDSATDIENSSDADDKGPTGSRNQSAEVEDKMADSGKKISVKADVHKEESSDPVETKTELTMKVVEGSSSSQTPAVKTTKPKEYISSDSSDADDDDSSYDDGLSSSSSDTGLRSQHAK